MKTDSGDQKPDMLDTPAQVKLNDFLEQIKEEQMNIELKIFRKYFPYKRSDRLAHILKKLKSKTDNGNEVNFINIGVKLFGDKVKEFPTGTNEKEEIKILDAVNKILIFNKQNQ